MSRGKGEHLTGYELALLEDMLEAREPTSAIVQALGVSSRTVLRHRDAFYRRCPSNLSAPGSLIDQCRDAHARLRKFYLSAIKEGHGQHAAAISKRMDEWKAKARTAANYERRAREAA